VVMRREDVGQLPAPFLELAPDAAAVVAVLPVLWSCTMTP
jgi:hypothetical protein